LRTAGAGFHGLAQFHPEDLGEYSVVQVLLDREISGAGPTRARTVQLGPHDHSVVAQRVQMEPNGRHMQSDLRGELDGVYRTVVRTHQLKYSFTLPVARQAISSRPPGLSVCFLTHLAPSITGI